MSEQKRRVGAFGKRSETCTFRFSVEVTSMLERIGDATGATKSMIVETILRSRFKMNTPAMDKLIDEIVDSFKPGEQS